MISIIIVFRPFHYGQVGHFYSNLRSAVNGLAPLFLDRTILAWLVPDLELLNIL